MSGVSLFERLGGAPAIEAAVDRFYERVLRDPTLKHFFQDLELDRQRAHQRLFLTWAFGGGSTYEGRGLRAAHGKLVRDHGLDDRHFDAVIAHLAETLAELGVSGELIAEVGDAAESLRTDVLGR